MTTDGGLFGSPRREGPTPKLVVIGIAWAAFGVVALITAVLMKSVGIAVFGLLCALAGGGLYLGQRARERLEEDERSWRSDPGGFDDDLDPEPDDDPDAVDDVAPDDDGQHDTRVMSTASRDHDDIVDAEYTEYYEPSPSEQDDGTGYDDEETAFRRRREEEWERETRAREDEPQVIEADDEDDRFEGAGDHGTGGSGRSNGDHPDDGTDRDGTDRTDGTGRTDRTDHGSRSTRDAQP
ncbi:hypothetical protein GCM10023201_34670 [Actinomycetospora corticicola]|uniref:Uncharacterized protein n=1 Tax=Actinomycetospora corticicola TaxID=663602 RepID=A0A7Y9J8V7_9PSEU|nr:hypothetical protein [Actinomycetospora corticicola]